MSAKRITQLEDLTPDPRNANRGTQRGASLLETSLRKYGAGRSILADRDGVVIAGNKTLEQAAALGLDIQTVHSDGTKLVVVVRDDLTMDDAAAKELGIADNRTSEVSLEWEPAVLEELSGEIDLSAFFFDEELQAILDGDATITEGLTDPDDVPDVPVEPTTKPGDLWLLGRHRLLCGDSTYKEQLDRLMNGKKADMVFTDPPYGVNVSGKGGNAIAGDLTSTAIFLMFDALPSVMGEGAWLYICGGSSNSAQYTRLFEHHFRQIPGMIIWDKGKTAVMRHNGYHSCYEIVYFSFKQGGGARWYSERTSDHADDIWRITLDSNNERDHPTQKPVELPARAIRNSCPPNGIVFEPFGGSGSTLIAAEQVGQTCYAVELDPKYCDVIIRRWEQFTGQTATLEAVT